jgi:hypothetical protein
LFIQVIAQPYKQQGSPPGIGDYPGAGMIPNANDANRSPAHAAARCNRNSMNLSYIIDALLHKYDKHLLPDPFGVNVTMEIHIQEISSISELTSDFELDLMYSEIW